jgi:hypothetical protein
MLEHGKLEGYDIKKAEAEDLLNCLKAAKDECMGLHSFLIECQKTGKLPEKDIGEVHEYMRGIRYWIFLSYLITTKVVREKAVLSENSQEAEDFTVSNDYRMKIK